MNILLFYWIRGCNDFLVGHYASIQAWRTLKKHWKIPWKAWKIDLLPLIVSRHPFAIVKSLEKKERWKCVFKGELRKLGHSNFEYCRVLSNLLSLVLIILFAWSLIVIAAFLFFNNYDTGSCSRIGKRDSI